MPRYKSDLLSDDARFPPKKQTRRRRHPATPPLLYAPARYRFSKRFIRQDLHAHYVWYSRIALRAREF
jgi:hypothetical protein